jgi:hypothetical protein
MLEQKNQLEEKPPSSAADLPDHVLLLCPYAAA